LIAFAIEDLDLRELPAGSKTELVLHVAAGVSGTESVPGFVVRGGEGPLLLAVAGVHGDEFEGPAALADAYRALSPQDVPGTFAAFPIANPFAYRAQTRASPEWAGGQNLARVMPGHATGTPTERLAAQWLDLARRNLRDRDLFLDLHSGGARYRYRGTAGYRSTGLPSEALSRAAAVAFGLSSVWRMPAGPETFNGAVAAMDRLAVGTETTGRGGLRQCDVAAYVRGIRNLLAWLADPPATTTGSTPEYEVTELLAEAGGLWRANACFGTRVASGSALGQVVDPLNRVRQMVIAPHAGEVWIERTFASVQSGDILVGLSRPARATW
jgi:predicted deacylase